MACLRNQKQAAAAATRNGIASLASRAPRLRMREVAKTVLRNNLHQYYRIAYLLGRHPCLTKGDTASLLLGSALATAVIMARLKWRHWRSPVRTSVPPLEPECKLDRTSYQIAVVQLTTTHFAPRKNLTPRG